MTTIGFADLLSGLNAGKLKGQSLPDLQAYFSSYMDRNRYPEEAVKVLYEGLRHKIAHLGHPYVVFDTKSKPLVFDAPHKRYAWTVGAARRDPPLQLTNYPKAQFVKKHSPPWEVWFDSRIRVSVRSLASDLIAFVFKSAGYFERLTDGSVPLKNFMKCMEEFYPR
jgi:hypothetical protein